MMTESDIITIYDTHIDRIYKFFYYRTLSREIAEDLTSDTFLAWAEKANNNYSMKDPVKYLYGISRKVFAKYLQSKYKENTVNNIEWEMVADTNQDDAKDISSVEEEMTLEEFAMQYISQIPKQQSRVLRMRLVEKMTLKEIAQKLGKDMNYVKTTQKRGIKSLKLLMECTP